MAKPSLSVSDSGAMPQPSVRDSQGNQSHGDGSMAASSAASASREIFQGLFKDLGKQAMAMEAILRLVCGKVDKLEHWVTEMSYGMTELDLKLRNIAHNIEGTAANVDDVASVSRWAVPVEEDPLEAATATVVKKVGVGLHKKKQMRMTGMVANILDQLTTVAETPVESESETHKSEEGGKKKKGKKAKDREKTRMKAEHVTGGGGEAMLSFKDNSPREAEAKADAKEKHKTHKKKKVEPRELAHHHEETSNDTAHEENAACEAVAGEAEERRAEEGKEKPQERNKEAVHAREDRGADVHGDLEGVHAEDEVIEGKAAEKVQDEEETHSARKIHINESDSEEDVTREVGTRRNEREREKPEAAEQLAEVREQVSTAEDDENAGRAATAECQDDEYGSVKQMTELSTPPALCLARELAADHPCLSADPAAPGSTTTPTSQSHTSTDAADQPSRLSSDQPPQETETETAKPVSSRTTTPPTSPKSLQTSLPSVEHTPRLSPIPSSRVPIDVTATAVPPQPTAPSLELQLHDTLATRTDLPTIRLEPLVIHDAMTCLEPALPACVEPDLRASVAASGIALNALSQPTPPLTKATSKKLRHMMEPMSTQAKTGGARSSPTKNGSRKALIRQSTSQRQPSLKKRRSQMPIVEDAKAIAAVSPMEPTNAAALEKSSTMAASPATPTTNNGDGSREEVNGEDDDDDEEDDEDDDDCSSSSLSSDSDGSVLDLGGSSTNAALADKKMSAKMTRTLTALNKLKKANVLSPDEIAELRQRATQKWFRLREHVKEKNKKDMTNILLKRKKNIFTVSNRIELLEEKSREVYASIKQLNTELKGKIEASTFDSLRRHVHDIHASLQVLDQKISKGDIPTMDHVKRLASETDSLRVLLLEQLVFARDHCDANHNETLKMFEEEWKRVAAIEKSMEDKLETLAAGFDAKILALPDYADSLEGIRRAIRKKADLKVLRELEAKLLGHEGESEDCLIRCLSCHKEVVTTNSHDATNNGDDNDVSGANSPHFKRVNPGTVSAKVYRSNAPLNAQPLVGSESTPELFTSPPTDDAPTPNVKATTPSRRAPRNEEPRPSPLSFIHVTATRAMAAAADASRPISAPSVASKKKLQPTSAK